MDTTSVKFTRKTKHEKLILLRSIYIIVNYKYDDIAMISYISNPNSDEEKLNNEICLQIYADEVHEMKKLYELGYFESYWCRPEYIRYKRQKINKSWNKKSSLVLGEQGYEIYKIILSYVDDNTIRNKSIVVCKNINNYLFHKKIM